MTPSTEIYYADLLLGWNGMTGARRRDFFLFLAAPHGLQNQFPLPGIKPLPPTVEVWSPNHWTAREVPGGRDFYLLCIISAEIMASL